MNLKVKQIKKKKKTKENNQHIRESCLKKKEQNLRELWDDNKSLKCGLFCFQERGEVGRG